MLQRLGSPVKVLFSGVFMGIAGIIPGVSSGTVAVIAGVYTKMIDAIYRLQTKGEAKKDSLIFLFLLMTGLVSATFLFAGIMENLMERYPTFMSLFFIGLIVGTLPLLLRQLHKQETKWKINVPILIPFLVALALVLYLGYAAPSDESMSTTLTFAGFIMIFAAGFISSGVGIIPGISGSMVLLTLGLYSPLISAINQRSWPFLIALALGALLGFIVFSRVIHALIHRYSEVATSMICGFLLGSALNLIPHNILGITWIHTALCVASLGCGFILAYQLGGEKQHG